MIPDKIICHCSATKDSGTVSWGAIRHYHTAVLGWRDIGYHLGIELVKSGDYEYYEAIMGRPWDEQGAHERKVNASSLGICFIGDFDNEEPPAGQLIVGARYIAYLLRYFNIPISEIYGHKDFRPDKTCPGKRFPMDKLISKVGEYL